MSRRKLCRPSLHVWRPIRGSQSERCTVCKTVFPCRSDECGHIDCYEAKGMDVPEWVPIDHEARRARIAAETQTDDDNPFGEIDHEEEDDEEGREEEDHDHETHHEEESEG